MNDHGFRKASPNGNYMLDTKAPQEIFGTKRCEVCGSKTDLLFPTKLDMGGELSLCQDCRDQFELAAEVEYQRQKEEL